MASDAEEREHLRSGLDASTPCSNNVAAGETLDPTFERSWSSTATCSRAIPEDLDELLEQLARRMAAASR